VAEHAKGLGYTLICGPELEFYLCEQAADGRWQRYANDPGNVYVVGRKGDPQGILLHMLRQGLDNRSAMLRIPPERGAAARMEVRLGDATANPYLAMAAIGAAVCLGIQDKAEPPPKLEGYGYDPARAEILPARLGDALEALEADRELADVLGEYFVTSFLAYKRNEIERFERFVTDWEFREYAYHL
jgi:glutamine synthetase